MNSGSVTKNRIWYFSRSQTMINCLILKLSWFWINLTVIIFIIWRFISSYYLLELWKQHCLLTRLVKGSITVNCVTSNVHIQEWWLQTVVYFWWTVYRNGPLSNKSLKEKTQSFQEAVCFAILILLALERNTWTICQLNIISNWVTHTIWCLLINWLTSCKRK